MKISFKNFDAFPHPHEDIRHFFKGSLSGAAVTIFSVILVVILVSLECFQYMTLDRSEELFVDTTRGDKLTINVDITVPAVSCNYLTLDAMDSAGDQHLHIDHNIMKHRLDLNGKPIEEAPIKEEVSTAKTKKNDTSTGAEVAKPKCGSCYGAEQNSTHCCNTCSEVIAAYHEKRWQPEPDRFEQCREKQKIEKESQKYALKEGCRISGHMEVNRMGGSFHVAPGKSFSLNHIHVHDVQPFSSSEFNVSHRINRLSFGTTMDFANTHPLNGMEVIAGQGAMMFQYYIKIVPTLYSQINGNQLSTNQFSVTRHSKHISLLNGETGMPGIFFSYELSPLMVKYTEKKRSFGHLATNICSIIGGVATVAGIIVTFLHKSLKVLKKD